MPDLLPNHFCRPVNKINFTVANIYIKRSCNMPLYFTLRHYFGKLKKCFTTNEYRSNSWRIWEFNFNCLPYRPNASLFIVFVESLLNLTRCQCYFYFFSYIFKAKPVNHCTSVCMHFRFILVDFCDNILMFRSKVVKNTNKFFSSVQLDSHIWLKQQNLFGNWNISEVYLQFDSILWGWKPDLFGVFNYFIFLKFSILYFSVKHFDGPQLQFPSYTIFMIYWMFS